MAGRPTVWNKILLTLSVCWIGVQSFPLHVVKDHDVLDAVDYLQQYGYLDTSSSNLMDESHVVQAIRRMQEFAGLNQTGLLDAETRVLMATSRCGVPDIHSSRTKRYSIHRWKWPKRILTWRIHNYGNDGIPRSVIRRTFKRSLEKWSNETNLVFQQIYKGEPDIWFKFAVGAHGDPSPFKRPWDGVIAHAFYPKHNTQGLAGDIHFNDDKHFSVNSFKGKNLPWVALHEIGHSIGLKHSKVKNSIMYPYYKSYKGHESQLTPDDVIGVQALYGKKNAVRPLTTKRPVSQNCIRDITAAFMASNKLVYVFIDRHLFVLRPNGGIIVGPISVWKIFKGVKSVDAAFRRHDDKTVLFRNDVFYVFSAKNRYISGPHPIKGRFAGLGRVQGNIDAAFVWPKTNSLYITKGRLYWRYHFLGSGDYALVPGYPKQMQKQWTNRVGNLDAAFTGANGATYLFKGKHFYELTNNFTLASGYPKEISKHWAKASYCGVKNDGLTEGRNAGVASSQKFTTLATTIILAAIMVKI